MTTGNRIFYACQNAQLGVVSGDTGTTQSWTPINGVQSVGINTNFNLEPIYQLGRLDVYENLEEIPEVEITLNRVLDGTRTIYEGTMGTGALNVVADKRSAFRLSLFKDNTLVASGTAAAVVRCEPAYLQQITYTFPTEGNFTEEATIVSNHKEWVGTPATATADEPKWKNNTATGVLRRGELNIPGCTFPTDLPSGRKITNITVSLNLGREELRELGKRTPYYRYVNFPVEVTTEIQVQARENGDNIGLTEAATSCTPTRALTNENIVIATCDGMVLNMGPKNKLTSVNFEGGDTGGGNATITYSYQTFNFFTYTAPSSPTPPPS